MVYGDGMAGLDVTGHGLTHAVTERTAKLAYHDQSGAMNESFSDIMGEMVERSVRGSKDWLIGEDASIGVIRSMQDPTRFGQPDNLRNYTTACADHGGVHNNSGIQNKAYFNIATSINSDRAERIFYRALTVYLSANATFEDGRAATLSAANDLYPGDQVVANGVAGGWNAVGVDGTAQPPASNCGGGGFCFAQASLSGSGLTALSTSGPDASDVISTLYQIRDLVMPNSLAGEHFGSVWEANTARAAQLVLGDGSLQKQAASLMQASAPSLSALADGQGSTVTVTPGLVDSITSLVNGLKSADGGGALTQSLQAQQSLVDLTQLVGLTFDQAVQNLSGPLTAAGITPGA